MRYIYFRAKGGIPIPLSFLGRRVRGILRDVCCCGVDVERMGGAVTMTIMDSMWMWRDDGDIGEVIL